MVFKDNHEKINENNGTTKWKIGVLEKETMMILIRCNNFSCFGEESK